MESFKSTLERHFKSIDIVSNGKSAVDSALSQPINYYSVIVLDISMPIMDGIEACDIIYKYLNAPHLATMQTRP